MIENPAVAIGLFLAAFVVIWFIIRLIIDYNRGRMELHTKLERAGEPSKRWKKIVEVAARNELDVWIHDPGEK